MQGPVLVTHHGRPRLVVLSAEEFARLADNAGGGSNPAGIAGDQVSTPLPVVIQRSTSSPSRGQTMRRFADQR